MVREQVGPFRLSLASRGELTVSPTLLGRSYPGLSCDVRLDAYHYETVRGLHWGCQADPPRAADSRALLQLDLRA